MSSSSYWACAQTHPHQEALALTHLRRQQFNAFFPFFMLPRPLPKSGIRNPDKPQHIVKPAFPGYVFIELDEQLNWAPINFTVGVRQLLTGRQTEDDYDYRKPYRAAFVDDLRRLRIFNPGMQGIPDSTPDLIPPGTTIKIINGAFTEHLALVELSTHQRISVLMKAFNREIRLEIGVQDVELVA
jgi:transcription antitermination factor NusG